jgi:hypothetical protein
MRGVATGWLTALAVFLTPAYVAYAAEAAITRATDLARDAMEARQTGLPILILFSVPGCPHCEAIRRAHLKPLSDEKPRRALVRQVDLGDAGTLIDFGGKPTTHDVFVKGQGVKFAPVVAFFTPDGKRAGEPLIGAMLPDFYASYLEEGLATAKAAISSPTASAAKQEPGKK